MAKRPRRSRQARPTASKTNWTLIVGVVGVGAIALFALLILSLQAGDESNALAEADTLLRNFCLSNEENCIEEGSPDAPVTLIEVSDYGCGHCKNFNLDKADALKAQYVETGKVRWVVLPFAIRSGSGQFPTLPSAVSAMCANEQGRFADYHKALFQLQGDPLFNTSEGFAGVAASLGMDEDALSLCLDSNSYENKILRNASAAQSAGVRVTPTFFINGRKVEGNLPQLADFQRLFDQALQDVEN